jgi:hypothetical protein
MGDACPQPDTRNRYEGRGSGDRIARLKALATRQGPAPTVQNSASWNLTRQQVCCVSCANVVCPDRNAVIQGAQQPDGSYTITGVVQGGSIVFNVATLEGVCTTTPNCRYYLQFANGVSGELVQSGPVYNCGEYITFTLPRIPSTPYSEPISGVQITWGRVAYAGTPLVECTGGSGDGTVINITLVYP